MLGPGPMVSTGRRPGQGWEYALSVPLSGQHSPSLSGQLLTRRKVQWQLFIEP